MLRSFRLGNHRSFRDEHEFLLMPVYDKARLALPVAAVYGANASGKSNLLDGLRFMAEAVRDSFGRWRPGAGVPRRPFLLDRGFRQRPSTFVVEIVQAGLRYTYGFEVDDERVLAEWLYAYPEKRKRVLFERVLDDIKFGRGGSRDRARLEVLEELLRPNCLFLSLAAQSNVESLLPVHRWFVEGLRFRLAGDLSNLEAEVSGFLREREGTRGRLLDLLRAADFGISDVKLGGDAGDELGILEKISEDLRARVQGVRYELKSIEDRLRQHDIAGSEYERLVKHHFDLCAELNVVDSAEANRALAAENFQRVLEDRHRRVRLAHGDEFFELADESAGTRSWLGLLPPVLEVLQDGGVLVVDEIDASLHSLLSARLVGLFNDPGSNTGGGQLVFTTHDATLLHPPLANEVLDRDEVWFVEKSPDGASVLYPLSDFKPRREDNLERRYLAGQYGAVPQVYEELFTRAVRGGADDGQA